MRSPIGLRFQIGHQQKVHNVHRIVGLVHIHCTPARRDRQKLAMQHRNLPPIRQLHRKFLKRLGFPKLSDSFTGHVKHYIKITKERNCSSRVPGRRQSDIFSASQILPVFANNDILSAMANESNSVTMNVSLPKPLKQYVDGKVSSGVYGSTSEFVREAIREKLEREHSRASLTAKLVEGLNSGRPIPFSDDYFKRKKGALVEAAQEEAQNVMKYQLRILPAADADVGRYSAGEYRLLIHQTNRIPKRILRIKRPLAPRPALDLIVNPLTPRLDRPIVRGLQVAYREVHVLRIRLRNDRIPIRLRVKTSKNRSAAIKVMPARAKRACRAIPEHGNKTARRRQCRKRGE